MTSKDAYDNALNIGDKAMRQLQFFVAICIAFGGWIFVGETIVGYDVLGLRRFLIAAVFSVPTLGLLVGTTQALKRLNAALDVSKNLFEKENKDLFEKENKRLSEAANRLHAHQNVTIAYMAMGGTILVIDLLILLHVGGDSG